MNCSKPYLVATVRHDYTIVAFRCAKNKGNASLSVEIYSDDSIIEWLDNYWNENILPLKGQVSESDHSERKQYPSDPGLTLFENQPDEEYYWEAVRGNVDFYEGGHQWGGNGRIGACSILCMESRNIDLGRHCMEKRGTIS